MRLICTFVAAGAVALLAASPAAPSSNMSHPRLIGTVGPGFTITLKRNGARVRSLTRGLYTFVVSDKASIHNFVLEGPGVERDITTVSFKGTKTVTLRLRKGRYKFYCRPHEGSMFGFIRVT
jgi:hypothetical protein